MLITKRFFLFICISCLCASCGELQGVFNKQAQTSFDHVKTNDHVRTDKDTLQKKTTHKKVEEKKLTKNEDSPGKQGRATIVTTKGSYYFVEEGDTLMSLSKRFKMSREHIAQINGLYESNLVVGRRIFIPNRKLKKEILSVTDIIQLEKPVREKLEGPVRFIWPLKDEFVLTSGFGWRHGRPHDALDLSAKRGTLVYAAAEGVVVFAKKFAGYGNLLVLKHARNYFTAYAHLQTMKTELGKRVKSGTLIGTVGNTGRSTGPHLHFEIHRNTDALDPIKLLPKRKKI